MALPPFDAGGTKLTVAAVLPATATTEVGAPGTPKLVVKVVGTV